MIRMMSAGWLVVLAVPTAAQTVGDAVLVPARSAPVGNPVATGIVPIGDQPVSAALYIADDRAYVRFRDERGLAADYHIHSPDAALLLLADRHYAFLWAPLTEWAGDDLGKLRQRYLNGMRAGFEAGRPAATALNSAQSAVRPATLARLQYADALDVTGDPDAAIRLLRDGMIDRNRMRGWQAVEQGLIATALARHLTLAGDRAAAIEILQAVSEKTKGSRYGMNTDVNLAAYLAEQGRHAEALARIDAAARRFVAEAGGEQVAGSKRHFDWIRGCALHGLGRTGEARALYDRLGRSATPVDRNFIVTSSDQIRVRAAKCIDDPAAYARSVADGAGDLVGPSGLLVVQPGWRPYFDPDWFRRVAAEPALKEALKGRVRVLPDALIPALNRWRPPAVAAR